MADSLISAAMVVATLLGDLGGRVATEYIVNVGVQQDHGAAPATLPAPPALPAGPAPADAAAPPPRPVLASAVEDAPAPPPGSAAPIAPTPAPTEPAVPASADAAAAGPPEAWQPSAELLGLTGDTPARRPDGSVFLPMPLQRLMGLRTQITSVEEVTPSLAIPGRVVSSRDVATLVQAKQGGVVEPAGAALPAIGARVAQGQLLATIRPVIDVVRRAELDGKIAELENLIQSGSQRILRLREVSFIRYRESKINAVASEVDGYRRQLAIFRALLDDVTEIRAHSDGVVSAVGCFAGQVVEPQSMLFEIVDPRRLWIEATAFDMSVAEALRANAGAGAGLGAAHAIAGDGRVVPLRFVGGGLALRGQAIPLSFEVLDDSGFLQIGRAVTVVVARGEGRARGIRLPVSALVRNAGGETAVWQRLGAESFVSRTVTTAPLDAATVLVTAGLAADMRIVVADTSLLSQVAR